MNTEIAYIEVDLKDVLNHYLQGYTFTNNRRIVKSESFIDPVKEKVVYKMIIADERN